MFCAVKLAPVLLHALYACHDNCVDINKIWFHVYSSALLFNLATYSCHRPSVLTGWHKAV